MKNNVFQFLVGGLFGFNQCLKGDSYLKLSRGATCKCQKTQTRRICFMARTPFFFFRCDKQLKKWWCHSAFLLTLHFCTFALCTFAPLQLRPLHLCSFAPLPFAPLHLYIFAPLHLWHLGTFDTLAPLRWWWWWVVVWRWWWEGVCGGWWCGGGW